MWSGASERERKNCTFRLGAEKEHSIEGKWLKEATLQREWVSGFFSRENDSDTRTRRHTHSDTISDSILFYECMSLPLLPNTSLSLSLFQLLSLLIYFYHYSINNKYHKSIISLQFLTKFITFLISVNY